MRGDNSVVINAHRIRIILAKRDMTQAELAKASGISRQNISTILGRGTCLGKTAGKLARGLGVGVEEIIAPGTVYSGAATGIGASVFGGDN